jgi:diguanylate cyclase (GGDEF)-like protein/PAS domain S-box-containing protein
MRDIRRVAILMLAIMVVSILMLLRLVAIRVVAPIANIAEGFRNFQLNRIPPGWRMARPKLLEPIANLAQWFNTFLDSMERRQESEMHQRIAATAFESQEGMAVLDAEARILRVNGALQSITGYAAEEVIGRSAEIFLSDRHDADFFEQMRSGVEQTGSWRGEVWNRRKNGAAYPSWVTLTGVRNGNDVLTHFVATLTDITERKVTEEEIRQLAFYDPLTGLPNRRLLIDRLRHAMLVSSRNGQALALMLLDLDKFKTLNDTLGHDAGDALLRQVSARLSKGVREADTVARLGGDEFVVLVEGLGCSPDTAAAHAEAIARKILAALGEDYDTLAGTAYHGSASIGIVVHLNAACTLEEIMKQADIALYQAKEAGRNTLRFFEPAMQARLMSRAVMEQSVRQGLIDDQFVIYLQPKVNGARRIVGAEALIRWQHPERGLVPPQAFITLAEETGLILPLGQCVMRKACEQLVAWSKRADRRHLGIAVNVSPREFRQEEFVANVLRTVQETGADPARLTLEITESLFVDDVMAIVEKMHALRCCGISFALDDFGTGYSSLSYLKKMPLQELKIDRSFVRDVLTDANDATIARAVIALGHELGIEVVAEGIETEEQRDFLLDTGCRFFQGYLFSEPVRPDRFDTLLNEERSAEDLALLP